ncbi:MAG: haloacid dehalogenase type II [Thermomicrobiales bacterium]
MSERPAFASFDCYGTLIDWEGGLGNFLYDFSLRHGVEPEGNGDVLRQRWEAIQFEIIQGPYRPYKDVLAESLGAWASERRLPYDDEDGLALVRAMRSWQPFPDTRPALAQARDAGLKLAILSNTDRDIIEHSLKHLEVPFDVVVTAEDCGAYKPSPANFERLLEEIGHPAEDVLHVAFGFKYDIGPANQAGMHAAWVNRHIEPTPPDARPDHIWRDLWGLPRVIGAAGPGIP